MADLKHQVPIDASPAKVYQAVATQTGMRNWWTADSQMDERIGGRAEFGFDKRAMVFRMDVKKLDSGKQVVLECHGDHPEWAGTKLTFTLAPHDGKTVLHLNHSGWKEVTDFCASCNSMWGNLMYRLKGYVEGKKPGPQWAE